MESRDCESFGRNSIQTMGTTTVRVPLSSSSRSSQRHRIFELQVKRIWNMFDRDDLTTCGEFLACHDPITKENLCGNDEDDNNFDDSTPDVEDTYVKNQKQQQNLNSHSFDDHSIERIRKLNLYPISVQPRYIRDPPQQSDTRQSKEPPSNDEIEKRSLGEMNYYTSPIAKVDDDLQMDWWAVDATDETKEGTTPTSFLKTKESDIRKETKKEDTYHQVDPIRSKSLAIQNAVQSIHSLGSQNQANVFTMKSGISFSSNKSVKSFASNKSNANDLKISMSSRRRSLGLFNNNSKLNAENIQDNISTNTPITSFVSQKSNSHDLEGTTSQRTTPSLVSKTAQGLPIGKSKSHHPTLSFVPSESNLFNVEGMNSQKSVISLVSSRVQPSVVNLNMINTEMPENGFMASHKDSNEIKMDLTQAKSDTISYQTQKSDSKVSLSSRKFIISAVPSKAPSDDFRSTLSMKSLKNDSKLDDSIQVSLQKSDLSFVTKSLEIAEDTSASSKKTHPNLKSSFGKTEANIALNKLEDIIQMGKESDLDSYLIRKSLLEPPGSLHLTKSIVIEALNNVASSVCDIPTPKATNSGSIRVEAINLEHVIARSPASVLGHSSPRKYKMLDSVKRRGEDFIIPEDEPFLIRDSSPIIMSSTTSPCQNDIKLPATIASCQNDIKSIGTVAPCQNDIKSTGTYRNESNKSFYALEESISAQAQAGNSVGVSDAATAANWRHSVVGRYESYCSTIEEPIDVSGDDDANTSCALFGGMQTCRRRGSNDDSLGSIGKDMETIFIASNHPSAIVTRRF